MGFVTLFLLFLLFLLYVVSCSCSCSCCSSSCCCCCFLFLSRLFLCLSIHLSFSNCCGCGGCGAGCGCGCVCGCCGCGCRRHRRLPSKGRVGCLKKSGWGARGEGAAPPPAMRAMRLAPRRCFLPIVWIDFDGVICYCCCLLFKKKSAMRLAPRNKRLETRSRNSQKPEAAQAKSQKPEGKGMKKTHVKMKKLKPMEKIRQQCKKLDDGWPESVEEQSLLLLVWRHYITR